MENNSLHDAYQICYPETTEGIRYMSLNEYQRRAMTTRLDTCNNFSYMSFGLVAEVGEVADIVAKAVRKQMTSIDSNNMNNEDHCREELYQGLKKELGDCLWFIAGLADYLGMSLQDVAQNNLDKLAARKATNTIIEHTDH